MSNQAQGLVRGLALKAPLKPILMAYAAYADELGYVWAGVDTIAFDTGYGETTVKDTRGALIRSGWMASKRRFGTSSIVRLNLDKMGDSQVDRGEARAVHPELEFEPETRRSGTNSREAAERKPAGRGRTAARRLTVAHEQPPGGCLDSRLAAVYSAARRPVIISDQSDDPSVDARDPAPPPSPVARGGGRHRASRADSPRVEVVSGLHPGGGTPTLPALTVVAGLYFGAHRRPTCGEAQELAIMVDEAVAGGLTVAEVRRHAQATVNAARPPGAGGNAVRYLANGLHPERLPAPGLRRAHGSSAGKPADCDGPTSDDPPVSGPAGPGAAGRRAAMAAVRALPAARPSARRPARGTGFRSQAGVLDG